MFRTIIDPMEQMRDFDFVSFEHDVLLALGGLSTDIMSALPQTVVGGLVAVQTNVASLSISVGAGRIYQFAAADTIAVGSIPIDTSVITQQGDNPVQVLTLVAPSAGQSQWNLVQAQFSQVDAVRAGDPNGGIVPFYNAANPSQPTTQSISTVRKGLCVLQVVTGSAATTGSEVPPNATSGWVPLYLIDLAGGQTQITTSQILKAAPSAGTGVPSNYAYAPFLAGLLASHHSGNAGQAPKIKLGSEVQGILPYVNMSPVRTLLSANLTLYVNANTGSDVNAGLTPATAFLTIQAAVNAIYHNYDFNGFSSTISVANGTYTTQTTVIGVPFGGTGLTITGNLATPGSCIVNVTNLSCFLGTLGCNLLVQGFSLAATGLVPTTTGIGIVATNAGLVVFGNVIFATCNNAHVVSVGGAQVYAAPGSSYSITGPANTHYLADLGGAISIAQVTITITGTPAFANSFAFASRSSNVQAVTGVTVYSGAATGARYIASLNGVVSSNGGGASFFPGSVAGSLSTGGQYV